jgi:hypothetical protein
MKEHVYAVPVRTMKDLVSRFKLALTTVGANMLMHVPETAAWHTAVCLEIDGGYFKLR